MSFGLLEKAVSSSHHSKFFEEGAERINRSEWVCQYFGKPVTIEVAENLSYKKVPPPPMPYRFSHPAMAVILRPKR